MQNDGDLIQCIYASTATKEFSKQDVADLLAVSRRRNAARDVTGMLLYEDGAFFQVLEGRRDVVESLYDRIAEDPRHQRVRKIISEVIEERVFGDWTMGYSHISLGELNAIPGLNDFFHHGRCFADLDSGRAKALLSAFREGRWRSSLT